MAGVPWDEIAEIVRNAGPKAQAALHAKGPPYATMQDGKVVEIHPDGRVVEVEDGTDLLAGRYALNETRRFIADRVPFGRETTLSHAEVPRQRGGAAHVERRVVAARYADDELQTLADPLPTWFAPIEAALASGG